MEKEKRFFGIGKLKHELLETMLKNFVKEFEFKDERVITGSKIGEDAAVIDMGDRYLVMKTDPITFVTDEIGYYAVNVNVNDVVCTGATPKWFQSTILLPEKTTDKDLIEHVFKSIHDTCDAMNISIVGGHTEVTAGINRPIVIGSLIGEVEKDELVNTSGAEPGDDIILTKGIFIEGTAIIGREKEELLKKKGYDSDFIQKCKNYLYDPGISVYNDALLANKHFKIKSMHDPTEGGLACGLAEMAIASKTGIRIESDKIDILPEPSELSKIFNLNPLNTISSGSLLIAISSNNSMELIDLLKKNGINAQQIGQFEDKKKGLKMVDAQGRIRKLEYSERDEIIKIF